MEDPIEINKNENTLTTSSPGKILLSRGYLVINPNYQGLVLCSKTYFICKGKIIREKTQTIKNPNKKKLSKTNS